MSTLNIKVKNAILSFKPAKQYTIYNKDSEGVQTDRYYKFYGLEIGSTYTGATQSSGTSKNGLKIPVVAGDKVKIYTYTSSASAGYVRPYCLVDSDNVVKQLSPSTSPQDLTSGYDMVVADNGYLYVDFDADHADIFKVMIEVQS